MAHKGKIGEFSLDALVNLATCAGMRVGLTIRPMARVFLICVPSVTKAISTTHR
jgi:hypothetical protein